ncbi:hypothetical protein INR49_019360 [Caranx melampygus]|nr:hypothetical protein INR49_019360 [Caranx melampygus]
MEAEASQTCFTCMASYCEEHLRPHRENPNFRLHQLTAVVSDLSERICPDHHKLMELFCSDHDRPICSFCLQQVHRGCSFISPEEQRSQKESELREKLSMLDGKIERTDTVVFQMNDLRSKLMDGAVKRKAAMAAVYQQMRDMLAQEERESQNVVDRELETCQTKLQDLLKKLTDNAVQMRKAREDINSLLSQAQTPAFLQVSFDLPWVVKIEPYVPRITLDSKKVTATQAYAVALKEHLTESFKLPVEARLPIFRPEPNPGIDESEPPAQTRPPRSHSPGRPLIQTYFQPVPVPVFSYQGSQQGWNSSQYAHGMAPDFKRGPPFKAGQKPQKKSDSSHQPPHHKKSDSSHQPPHHQEKKKPSTPGGQQGGTQPGFTKKDHPKGHHASDKSAKHNPQPKKKN